MTGKVTNFWREGEFSASDGAALSFSVSRQSPPQIILLHSMGGYGQQWGLVAEILDSAGWGCAALSFRGSGTSQRTPCNASSARLAADVLELANFMGLDRFMVVGHSMGGKVGLHALGLAPNRISAVALLGSPGPGLVDIPRAVLAEILNAPNRRDWAEKFFRPWFVVWDAPEVKEWIASFSNLPDWALTEYCEAALWTDISSSLPDVFPPVAVIAGQDDPVYGPTLQKQVMYQYFPHARYYEIQQCGHGLIVEQPRSIADQLCSFFKVLC